MKEENKQESTVDQTSWWQKNIDDNEWHHVYIVNGRDITWTYVDDKIVNCVYN